jgi:hypothetical protein
VKSVSENAAMESYVFLCPAVTPCRQKLSIMPSEDVVAGRGYQFTGEIRGAAGRQPPAPASSLPEPVSELIGRDEPVREVIALATSHRLVTLTGAGGIGKTRLALEVARRLLPRFADGVGLAELAPLTDPQLVPGTVASAFRLTPVSGTASFESVAAALAGWQALVVLDNCEHLIEAAAHMAEALLRACPPRVRRRHEP